DPAGFDDAHHRPSPLDGGAGRCRGRHRRRPHRGPGHTRGAARVLTALPRAHGGQRHRRGPRSGRRSGMSSIRLDSDDEIEQLPPDIAAKARALLMSLVRPHLRMVVFLAVIVVLTSVLLVIGPVFIADALDQGIHAPIDGDLAPLTPAIGSAILAFTSTRLVGITSQKILYRLRERMFTHVQRLDLGYHEKSTSGRLVSRQTSDMESVQQFLSYSLFETALALLQMIF